MSPSLGFMFQRERALFYIDFCIPFDIKYHASIIIITIKIGVARLCSRYHGDTFPKLSLIIATVVEGRYNHSHFTEEDT